jgi:hypothetical protein
VAKIQLPALPQGIGGPDAVQLVLQINDRLRRIALALGDAAGSGNGSAGSAGGAIELETNGVDNTLQSKLNLIAGSNVTLAADSLGGVSIASAGGGTVVSETPSGTLNGTNAVFTLSHTPSPVASLLLFLNGVEQLAGTDYTLSSATITYAVAPDAADWHVAEYTH